MSSTEAFGPASITKGALLPTAGRELLIESLGLPPGVLDATRDGWLTPEVPVLVRGSVRILPVAWFGAADRGYNPYAEPREISGFGRRLQDMGMYAAGPWRAIDLSAAPVDTIGSYATALRSAGVTAADRFVYVQDHLGLVIVWSGDEEAGTRSLALHVVPEGWVFEPAAGPAVLGIDVSWSWADVIALADIDAAGHAEPDDVV